MNLPEDLSSLSEQDLARYTRSRFEDLARKSKFNRSINKVIDGVSKARSREHLSLYFNPQENTVTSVKIIEPVRSMPLTGVMISISVIVDPLDSTKFIGVSAVKNHFSSDGENQTYFLPPQDIIPHSPMLEYPKKVLTENPETVTEFMEDDSPNSALQDNLFEVMLEGPLSRRSAEEVDESRKRLLHLNEHLDKLAREAVLIPAPEI